MVGFLTLPPELREKIYGESLMVPHRLRLCQPAPGTTEDTTLPVKRLVCATQTQTQTPPPVALLRTCRTIYDEASRWLYAENTFEIDSAEDLHVFTMQIGGKNAALVKELVVPCPYVGTWGSRGTGCLEMEKYCADYVDQVRNECSDIYRVDLLYEDLQKIFWLFRSFDLRSAYDVLVSIDLLFCCIDTLQELRMCDVDSFCMLQKMRRVSAADTSEDSRRKRRPLGRTKRRKCMADHEAAHALWRAAQEAATAAREAAARGIRNATGTAGSAADR